MDSFLFSLTLVLLLLAHCCTHAAGLEAHFTPTDEDQLPLSAKYRQSLRRLCKLLRTSQTKDRPDLLPAEMREPAKRVELEKICAKLSADDAQEAFADRSSSFSISLPSFSLGSLTEALPKALAALAGVGGAHYLWKHRGHWLRAMAGPAQRERTATGTAGEALINAAQQAREARLRRFDTAASPAPAPAPAPID